MTVALTTPLGLWLHAKQFADAARAVRGGGENHILLPAYYLLGHSIELSLKAFLLGRGVPLTKLKSKTFGHDIKALLTESRNHRLGSEVKLDPREIGVIILLNHDYVAKRFEYRETGTYHLPYDWLTQNIADKLVKGLKRFCERVTLEKHI